MTEKLATEIDTYNSQIDSWKADHVGQFVLIHGTDVGGFFDSYEESLACWLRAIWSGAVPGERSPTAAAGALRVTAHRPAADLKRAWHTSLLITQKTARSSQRSFT